MSNQRGTRAASQDSGSSVDRKSVERSSTTSGSAKKLGIREKKCEVRLTRSKLSPKTKAEAIAAGGGSSVSNKKKSAKESEREKRARLREQVKEQEEEEDGDSSDWSEGEEGEGQEEGKEEGEGGKSDSDLEADEEASSRESSRRPSTRRSQGKLITIMKGALDCNLYMLPKFWKEALPCKWRKSLKNQTCDVIKMWEMRGEVGKNLKKRWMMTSRG